MHDENLIEGLRLGDEQAYKSLYKLHYKVLCAFAYTYVKDYFVAETLVSDIIFNIWEKRDSLIINQSLRAYLMKAVKNSSINYLDHLERQNNLRQSVSQQMEKREESFHEQDYYPMSSLLEKELEGKIMQSVSSLPEFTREIFEMSRHDGLKYEEIAARKNITIDIVKYHIRLSLNQLRHDFPAVLADFVPFYVKKRSFFFTRFLFSFVISIEEEHYGYTNYRSGILG